jgi:c-di-GMP-binding flagellar brake protein YcgR
MMRFQDLNLAVGSPMSLELCNQALAVERPVRLIGYSVDNSLILTRPQLAENEFWQDSDMCVVRFFTGGNAFAFRVRVLAQFDTPFPHVHMQFPTRLSSVVVRTQPRFPVVLPLDNLSQERLGITMVDVSMFGARLVCCTPLGELHDQFDLELRLPLSRGERQLKLYSVIRYVRRLDPNREDSEYHHGVEFKSLSAENKVIIQQYINEQQGPTTQPVPSLSILNSS